MTATAPPAGGGHIGLARLATDIAILTRRNVLRNIRVPQLLLFATVQPVMFLALFNYVFGGSIGAALGDAFDGKYINFLLPGLLAQTAIFSATQTAVGLTEDLGAGVIDRFRSLPMARSAVLAGRTLADGFRSGFVITLLIAVGLVMGFRPQAGVVGVLGAIVLAVVFGFAFSWVMATIGLAVKTPEAAQSAGFLPIFPLVFASSVFVAPTSMPSWLESFSANQPVTILADTMRALMLGDEFLAGQARSLTELVLLTIVWTAVIFAVFAPLSVRLYRRAVG